ncbi:MAG: SLC13 family permease [Bacteroidota bacterium]
MPTLVLEYQAYLVPIILVAMFVSIYMQWLKPTVAFLFAALALVILGIITPRQVLEGFSNQSIASVAIVILLTAGVRENFNIELFLNRVFGGFKSYRSFLLSMMSKVAVLSSFVNNTPVVVLMTPYVFDWGRKNNISPSKLLIPLSYATILGGMITVIGTSTTLVLNGFLMESKLSPIDPIDLLLVGISVSIVCILFLALFSSNLLPSRTDIMERFELNKREYLIEKRLSSNSKLIGKSVIQGGLRNLNGVYLVEIVRNEELITPVSPDEVIQKGDILIFAGNTDNIIDLTLTDIGIELPPKLTPSTNGKVQVIEAVVSANSSLLGKSVKESNFRERYDAAVIAIHRNGERLSGKIGRISLKAGDVLLMYTGDQFIARVDLFKDLYIIAGEEKEIRPGKPNRTKFYLLFSAILVLLFGQFFNLFVSLLILLSIAVAMRVVTLKHVKRDLDLNLIIILVLSISIGEAMINSGAGEMISMTLINVLSAYGALAVLAGLMIIATFLTSFVTNVGAIAICFPLALAISNQLGVPGEPFFLAIAFAASAAFLTPIGYQTNLIIYGPGGYNFRDFLKIGFPITILYLGTAFALITIIYQEQFTS